MAPQGQRPSASTSPPPSSSNTWSRQMLRPTQFNVNFVGRQARCANVECIIAQEPPQAQDQVSTPTSCHEPAVPHKLPHRMSCHRHTVPTKACQHHWLSNTTHNTQDTAMLHSPPVNCPHNTTCILPKSLTIAPPPVSTLYQQGNPRLHCTPCY